MSNELKPVRCGCGGTPRINQRPFVTDDSVAWFEVYCDKCLINTDEYTTKEEATKAWNMAMGAKDIDVPSKETPKQVKDVYSIGDYDEVYVYGFCPECGAPVIQPDKYCSECGQRLEWK